MITTGLSQHELDRIIKILEENHVEFNVDAAQSAGAQVQVVEGEEEAKTTPKDNRPKGPRGQTSFYQIEILHEEYEKLPPQARTKLEGLGIYPEMDAPDFDHVESHTPSDATAVRNKLQKIQKPLNLIWVFIIIVGFIYGMMKIK